MWWPFKRKKAKLVKIVMFKSERDLWRWQFVNIATNKAVSLMVGRGSTDGHHLHQILSLYFPDYEIEVVD